MSYSRSPKTIARVKPLLDELVSAEKDIEWIFKRPQKVAYCIWEAIKFAARSGKEEYKKYTELPRKFRIRYIEPNILKAEIRDRKRNGSIVRKVNDAIGVIGAVIESKKEKLIFPDFEHRMEEDDLELIARWCKDNSYKYSLDEQDQLTMERI